MSDEARRARELLGLPVFSIADGERVGEVDEILVDRESRSVGAIGITGGAFGRMRYLPFSQIKAIGSEAVMVESRAVLQEDLPRDGLRELDNSLPGRAVLTASGQKVGEIAGFKINVASGQIERFRVRPETGALARLVGLERRDILEVPDASVFSLGSDALIVRDGAVSLL